jgi:SAM-dependent methyltransferase
VPTRTTAPGIITPIVDEANLAHLSEALSVFSTESVNDALGWEGEAAFARNDLCGVSRVLGRSRTDTLIRLFLLGESVPIREARAALGPLDLDAGESAGLVEQSVDEVRALLEVRPFAAPDAAVVTGARDKGRSEWHLLADFGSDVRPRDLDGDHVLGISRASRLLSDCTIRRPVGRTLDIGTGSGFQAFGLLSHSASVTGTDINLRALRFAATSAALADVEVDLRSGAGLAPVHGEVFDLVVANPPFVMSPGIVAESSQPSTLTYRDSGHVGDSFCSELVNTLPDYLTEAGTAQLLANWAIRSESDLTDAVRQWVRHDTVDAWVWQREVVDPGEYIAMWLRDDGEIPNSPRWRLRYGQWRDWFAGQGIVAVGMGLVNLRRVDGRNGEVVVQDVRQQVKMPIGAEIDAWFCRLSWLRDRTDEDLLNAYMRTGAGLTIESSMSTHKADSMEAEANQALLLSNGMQWRIECDQAMAAVVTGCDGRSRLSVLSDLVADAYGLSRGAIAQAVVSMVRDLVQRGILLPDNSPESPGLP